MDNKNILNANNEAESNQAGERFNPKADMYEIDLIELLLFFKKHILFILIVGLLFANIAALFTCHMMSPAYESMCKMFILSKETTISSLADLNLGTQLAQDYFILTKSRPVLNKVIANLELDMDYEQLLPKLTITNPTDSHILELSVVDSDPYKAQIIVNEIASVSAEYISEKMEVAVPHIIEEGILPYKRTSPNMTRNVEKGFLVGVGLALAIITIMFLLNNTISTEEDVTQYLGLYTLADVPDKLNKNSNRKSKHSKDRTNS